MSGDKPVYASDYEGVRRGAGLALFAAARGWLGTPYEHAQRVKGVAVDCVGLVLCAAVEAGLMQWEEWDGPTQYSPWVNAEQLAAQMGRLLRPLAADEELWTGDVLLFTVGSSAQHVGVFGDARLGRPRPSVVHASLTDGRVVEHDYERFWRGRTAGRHRWRIGWLDELEKLGRAERALNLLALEREARDG